MPSSESPVKETRRLMPIRRLPNTAVALLLFSATILLTGCQGNLLDMLSSFWTLGCIGTIIAVLDIIALVEIAGSRKSTGKKVLWALFIIFLPFLGLICYFLFGR